MLTADALPDGVTVERLEAWYDRFRFYRHSPSRDELQNWLAQFGAQHCNLAAKVLDEVVLLSDAAIQQGYFQALQSLPGWSVNEAHRLGRWAFVGLGGQAESGPAMLHMFREANGLTGDRHQRLFVTPADLPQMRLTAQDTVIFVDDFSGTGDQFTSRWNTFRELISSEAKTYLFLAAATSRAVERIAELEELEVRAELVLGPEKNVFSEACDAFNESEQQDLLHYCKLADKKYPKGWGECGILLVISRKTPNNSLPILHAFNSKWKGIFPRNLPVAARAAAMAA